MQDLTIVRKLDAEGQQINKATKQQHSNGHRSDT